MSVWTFLDRNGLGIAVVLIVLISNVSSTCDRRETHTDGSTLSAGCGSVPEPSR